MINNYYKDKEQVNYNKIILNNSILVLSLNHVYLELEINQNLREIRKIIIN